MPDKYCEICKTDQHSWRSHQELGLHDVIKDLTTDEIGRVVYTEGYHVVYITPVDGHLPVMSPLAQQQAEPKAVLRDKEDVELVREAT